MLARGHDRAADALRDRRSGAPGPRGAFWRAFMRKMRRMTVYPGAEMMMNAVREGWRWAWRRFSGLVGVTRPRQRSNVKKRASTGRRRARRRWKSWRRDRCVAKCRVLSRQKKNL